MTILNTLYLLNDPDQLRHCLLNHPYHPYSDLRDCPDTLTTLHMLQCPDHPGYPSPARLP